MPVSKGVISVANERPVVAVPMVGSVVEVMPAGVDVSVVIPCRRVMRPVAQSSSPVGVGRRSTQHRCCQEKKECVCRCSFHPVLPPVVGCPIELNRCSWRLVASEWRKETKLCRSPRWGVLSRTPARSRPGSPSSLTVSSCHGGVGRVGRLSGRRSISSADRSPSCFQPPSVCHPPLVRCLHPVP